MSPRRNAPRHATEKASSERPRICIIICVIERYTRDYLIYAMPPQWSISPCHISCYLWDAAILRNEAASRCVDITLRLKAFIYTLAYFRTFCRFNFSWYYWFNIILRHLMLIESMIDILLALLWEFPSPTFYFTFTYYHFTYPQPAPSLKWFARITLSSASCYWRTLSRRENLMLLQEEYVNEAFDADIITPSKLPFS